MRCIITVALVLGAPGLTSAQQPVIDMHLHALPADAQGPPPLGMCTPIDPFPTWDPSTPFPDVFLETFRNPPCSDTVWSPRTDTELKVETLEGH